MAHRTSRRSPMHDDDDVEVVFEGGNARPKSTHNAGVPQSESRDWHKKFEEAFDPFDRDKDDLAEFFDDDVPDDDDYMENLNAVYHDPRAKEAVLDEGVHEIPGSPWAKPANKPSKRPTEPLAIAKYSSSLALAMTVGWIGFVFFLAIWNYSSVGLIIVEIFLGILSFFGLFWNSYFTVSSIFKCFIPAQAFRTNTKYCSVVPEEKPQHANWMNTTIQIPVYKESLEEVLMPTLKSCMQSRDHYMKKTGANCNIVICDDGMMAFLKNNFAAAEMLWETIEATEGGVFKLSQLLQRVPRPSRRHLKGLSSHSVYEVFHRMLFYYHYDIGFVARSTWDRRGKFKKASNLNTHLRLVWGAEQIAKTENLTFDQALIQNSHNGDGSRYTMFGNDISIGHLIIVNDADARMSEAVIFKTVPEFLNDKFLGFTQHSTKTMDDQRGESYYINMLSVYTDALYQGHFLLSSILGCHPPLVGHSIFLRSEAVKQCGRIRTLRKAQRWLQNIGLPFLSVDQVGLNNLQDHGSTEYWSENHVSEDFELMIHLYNLGFNGRYVAYPDCEFQEGITRTFDEEAGRHRKFALGAHELMFNPINSWIGQGVFSPLFRTFIQSDIPSYYKIFLTAYLFSYTSGGAYLMVFSIAAIARLLDKDGAVTSIALFNSAGVLAMSVVVYYVIGYTTFLIAMVRMRWCNKMILFPEYRNRGACYLIYMKVRYCMFFQLLFYTVMGNYFFLGSMDHLLSKPGVVSATNKDSINISRCTALYDVIKFNSGSWLIALYLLCLAYATVLENEDWDYTSFPEDYLYSFLFAGPPAFIAVCTFIVPLILNPFVLGWPFNPPLCAKKKKQPDRSLPRSQSHRRTQPNSGKVVGLDTFMTVDAARELNKEMGRVHKKPDVELGSLATHEFGGGSKYPMSAAGNTLLQDLNAGKKPQPVKQTKSREEMKARDRSYHRPEQRASNPQFQRSRTTQPHRASDPTLAMI
mmetsp:Transcript_108151/g.161785  ORF Transcript_108151/g.161785 Transcript_108151/m.161785 type:complete len:975 (+) Transcript_108151:129-3053(+)